MPTAGRGAGYTWGCLPSKLWIQEPSTYVDVLYSAAPGAALSEQKKVLVLRTSGIWGVGAGRRRVMCVLAPVVP